MKRLKLKLVLFVFIVFIILGAAKDLLFQSLLQKNITHATGLKATIGTVHVSLFNSYLQAKEILIYNPERFKDRNFARILDLFIDFDLTAFFKGKYLFREIRIVIGEFFIIKDQEGLINIEALDTLLSLQKKDKSSKKESKTGALPLQIDKLDLTVRRIIYKNSEAIPSTVHEIDPEIRNESFENLSSPEEVIRVILLRALTNHALSQVLHPAKGHGLRLSGDLKKE